LRCAIAHDNRHHSREFAELSAEIMVSAGFTVFFLDGVRSTPELSFLVRHKRCLCGIMVTASHNPPDDNAVKVYGPSGGQLLPPHDRGVIDAVAAVREIRRVPFGEAYDRQKIVMCQDETDRAFLEAVSRQSTPGTPERRAQKAALRILYSPLHGVGATVVVPALLAAGFSRFSVYGPHAQPDPDFPNVPDHIANPERPVVFEQMIRDFRESVDLIMATDPDGDRIGFAVPKSVDPGAEWVCLTGNQAAVLLAVYRLNALKRTGSPGPEHYLVKTIVTTEMLTKIAQSYGVRMVRHLLVGFKYIGETVETLGERGFVFAAEESYGYLVGAHTRDKDASVTAMVMAEFAAELRAQGRTLYMELLELYRKYGLFVESQFRLPLPGADGMERTKSLMRRFRTSPPDSLGGMKVVRTLDYQRLSGPLDGEDLPISGASGDVVVLYLEGEGNYAAIRPSGTEPLVKVYSFAHTPVDQFDPERVEEEYERSGQRLKRVEEDLRRFAEE
ncbi:MAG: phospho-sugar mutase, partial [Planctomycetia bacterium]|nr:phospho-sugar mutase [Planctomycetia bacterium]